MNTRSAETTAGRSPNLVHFMQRFLSGVWVALACCAACNNPSAQSPIIARVGEAELTQADLAVGLPAGLENESETASNHFVENWVRQELLYQEALARKLDQNVRIQYLVEQTRRDLLVAALLDLEFDGRKVEVTEPMVKEYYQQHREEFLRTEKEIRVRHILVASGRDAQARRQDLLQGSYSFEEVARAHSLDEKTKFAGGDLGYFSPEDNPVMWDACRELFLNRLSKPVRTQYGYHIVEVLDRQEAGTFKDLEQVRSLIVESLVRREHRQRLDRFVDQLKSTSEWVVHQDLIKNIH